MHNKDGTSKDKERAWCVDYCIQ